jgi:hypothetical protein
MQLDGVLQNIYKRRYYIVGVLSPLPFKWPRASWVQKAYKNITENRFESQTLVQSGQMLQTQRLNSLYGPKNQFQI